MKNLPSGVTIPSGGGAQISNTRWVDAAAAGGGDGSIGLPFQTIQEGLTALAALAGNKSNLMVFPGQYGEATPVWAGDHQLLVSNAVSGFWVLGSGNTANQPFLDNQFDCGGQLVAFSGIELFEGFTSTAGVDCYGCKIWQLADTTLHANFRQCSLIGVAGSFTSATFESCSFNSGIITFTVDGDIYVTNTSVVGTPGPTFVFPAAGELFVDDMFNYWFIESVATLTNGTKTVMA